MLLLGTTGLLLTWKKEIKLSPPSQKSTQVSTLLIPLGEIQDKALFYADSLQLDQTINRIDYRPTKGMAKIRFEYHLTEFQIDCHTGKLLSIKQRNSDLVEMIHDGSIIDYLFKSDSEYAKLIYSSLTSLGLILLSISGFFLWLKPMQIKKIKHQKH